MLNTTANSHYHSHQELLCDCSLIETSGLLDEPAYRAAAGLGDDANVAAHYLTEGWRLGIEPNRTFEGCFLYPYFRSIGFTGPPAISFLTLRAAGWAVYSTSAEVEHIASLIQASGMFDAAAYAARLGNQNLSPPHHYVLVGERMGYAPSSNFDPVYYGKRYPDIALAGTSFLAHYIWHGRNEGRRTISLATSLAFDRSRLDATRRTVLLVVHQATRTGAPILAYNIAEHLGRQYNVVALLLSGGELTEAFERVCDATVGPLQYSDWHRVEADYIIERLLASYEFVYAIVNSINSRIVLKPLNCAHVPIVTLIHEFATHLRTEGEMGRALEWSTVTVFSADAVLQSVRAEYPNIDNWAVHILPQGQSILPTTAHSPQLNAAGLALRDALRAVGKQGALLVLGCGTIYFRKGVDLFISCAAAVHALNPKHPVHFLWIGRRLDSSLDGEYYLYLVQQIERAGLQDSVTILDEVADLDSVFASTDVFFLSSRLDPLPNVAIDAAMHGTPIVCFDKAGGMSDILNGDPQTRLCVVPYADAHAAGKVIAQLADDEVLREGIGEATRQIGSRTFNMRKYVSRLDEFGRQAARIMRQRDEDLRTIAADSMFDTTSFLGRGLPEMSRDDAIRLFLARSAAFGTSRVPTANFYYRRPAAGFHPQIYAHENAVRYETAVVNPLAHFIRSGKPNGPWSHEVIGAPVLGSEIKPSTGFRTALHIHFHYPELAREFLEKMSANRSPCDLLISTNSGAKAKELQEAMADYRGGAVTIRVVPNRGRDIGPFLTEFAADILHRYDLIGHVHSKRSLFTDAILGETWREFLWQNLLGNLYPMMDLILERFAADDKLGLVFPEDPHLADWDKNLAIAEKFAHRMGISGPLEPFFDFPVGTMFWARVDALRPMFDLGLDWDDYPSEPVPIDGTTLHALERLVPFAVRKAGHRYATTHIAGLTW